MKLLVIRHAKAEDAEEFARTGASDDLRPLTDEGWKEMKRAALGLHRVLESIDVMGASPLLRARQTAEIVAREFDISEIAEVEALRPGVPHSDLLAWLNEAGAAGTIAVVGHSPHLNELVAWLVTGSTDSSIGLKKGAAVMLELSAAPEPGNATLLWALTPSQLRKLRPA